MMQIVGRQREIQTLNDVSKSQNAEFVALYGRRRIGKTFLIHNMFEKKEYFFEISGIKDGTINDQLLNFTKGFTDKFYPGLEVKPPKSWREAFELLTKEIQKTPKNKKFIFFMDELPWLATKKSSLLQNIDYFWNQIWSKIPNFKLIVCGSAASWILNNLVNAKGGLYNRITKSINLGAFSLKETKEFLEMKKIKLNHDDIIEIYMIMGGVPFYLNQLSKSTSIASQINELCFKKDGLLYNEFPRLFKSLFDESMLNLQITREIASKRYGISFKDLLESTGKKSGGRFKLRLEELEASGFIQAFLPLGRKKRGNYYKVVDPYTLFYLKWIENHNISNMKSSNYWLNNKNTSSWHSWAGFSFELICYLHIDQILVSLNLDKMKCQIGDWKYKAQDSSEDGAQIDLVIDREDDAITLCEIKYTGCDFSIDKACAKNLINKSEKFETKYNVDKQIFWAIISNQKFKKNIWSEDLISDVVGVKALFG
jgi:hypothetical protein